MKHVLNIVVTRAILCCYIAASVFGHIPVLNGLLNSTGNTVWYTKKQKTSSTSVIPLWTQKKHYASVYNFCDTPFLRQRTDLNNPWHSFSIHTASQSEPYELLISTASQPRSPPQSLIG